MSDVLAPAPTVLVEAESAAGHSLTAGTMLRTAREAAGLHVAALAVSLKVPVKKLEALEADRWDLLPDAVFARALAGGVCRALKLDPAPILDKLPHVTSPRLQVGDGGLNEPFRATGHSFKLSMPVALAKPAAWIVLLLLLAALLVFFVPIKGTITEKTTSDQQALPGPAVADPVIPIQPNTTVQLQAEPVGASSSVPVASLPAAQPSSPVIAPIATPSISANMPAQSSQAVMTTGVATTATAQVHLKARGSSWVEIVDAKGTVQVRKTLTFGEQLDATGPAPLSIVIGKSDVMDVSVRGEPLNLAPSTKENVARFEVK